MPGVVAQDALKGSLGKIPMANLRKNIKVAKLLLATKKHSSMKEKNVDDLDAERLRSYFLYGINTLKLSENTLHSRINAGKFYFEQVMKREKFFF